MAIQTISSTDIPVIATNYRIPIATFTGLIYPNPNSLIFLRELQDLGLSITPLSVHPFPNEVVVACSSAPTAGDETLINTAASNHKGFPFEQNRREWFYDTVVQAPFNATVDALVAQGNNFRAGNYDIEWYAELRINDEASLGYAKAVFWYKVDGPVESRSMSSNVHDDWVSFSGKFPVVLKDGSYVAAKLTIQSPPRTGQTATARNAEIRRCRIFMNKVG